MTTKHLSPRHCTGAPVPVFENTYFTFFFRFKNMTFTFFWNDVQTFVKTLYQKFSHQSVKMSSVITVIQFPAPGAWSILSQCWMRCLETVASKFSDVMVTYRRLSHTVLSCIVSCVRISEQDVWRWWLTGTNFRQPRTKGRVIEWPVKLYVRFFRFFSRFFELLHTFSRTLASTTHWCSCFCSSCRAGPPWRSGSRRDPGRGRTCAWASPGRAGGRRAQISTERKRLKSSHRADDARLPVRHRRLSSVLTRSRRK